MRVLSPVRSGWLIVAVGLMTSTATARAGTLSSRSLAVHGSTTVSAAASPRYTPVPRGWLRRSRRRLQALVESSRWQPASGNRVIAIESPSVDSIESPTMQHLQKSSVPSSVIRKVVREAHFGRDPPTGSRA